MMARMQTQAPLPLEFSDRQQGLGVLAVWCFLASDTVLFACLFAVYAVYTGRVADAPGPAQLLHVRGALPGTLLLLTSSFTCGLATHQLRRRRVAALQAWLAVTALLGLGFVLLELREFAADLAGGASWRHSAFLSAFFTLVGTHGAHVSFGVLWALVLVAELWRRGLTATVARRVYTFSLYWHFLDIVWVFIFTVVYLGGRLV